MKDLLLCIHVVVKTLNLEISPCYLAHVIFPYSSNQIIIFRRRRCRCSFQWFNYDMEKKLAQNNNVEYLFPLYVFITMSNGLTMCHTRTVFFVIIFFFSVCQKSIRRAKNTTTIFNSKSFIQSRFLVASTS